MQKNCLGIKLYDAMSAGLRPYMQSFVVTTSWSQAEREQGWGKGAGRFKKIKCFSIVVLQEWEIHRSSSL